MDDFHLSGNRQRQVTVGNIETFSQFTALHCRETSLNY